MLVLDKRSIELAMHAHSFYIFLLEVTVMFEIICLFRGSLVACKWVATYSPLIEVATLCYNLHRYIWLGSFKQVTRVKIYIYYYFKKISRGWEIPPFILFVKEEEKCLVLFFFFCNCNWLLQVRKCIATK